MPQVNESASTGAVFSTINVGGVDYRVAVFSTSGTLVVDAGGDFDVFVQAGGGSGGGTNGNFAAGGGGGAGGRRKYVAGESGNTEPGPINLSAGTYTIQVGEGGAVAGNAESGNDGEPSAIVGVLSADGGGGGGMYDTAGRAGGCGGGAGGRGGTGTLAGGTATTGQGNNGGSNTALFNGEGAGGGGTQTAGGDSTGAPDFLPGAGGDGAETSITGTPTRYGAGGGGGASGTGGSGGLGGGGAGGGFDQNGLDATEGTGSGGGGAGAGPNRVGGKGGRGVVILRWPLGGDAGSTVTPDEGSLALTGLSPTVAATENVSRQPGTGSLNLAGQAPAAVVGNSRVTQPGTGALVVTGQQPVAVRTDNRTVQPGPGSLSTTGQAPDIPTDRVAQPPATEIVLTGRAPVIRVRPKTRPVNLVDDPRLTGRHRNIRMRGLEKPEQPDPEPDQPPVLEVTPEPERPRAPGLAGIEIPVTSQPPPVPLQAPQTEQQPQETVVEVVLTPSAEPYQSDLDPFYEPEQPTAQAADKGLKEVVAELRAQVQALAELVEELRKPPPAEPYKSDLDPFYQPAPDQLIQPMPTKQDIRAENRKRAEVIARSLLNGIGA